MMNLTFGLFTQVSGSGPLGPLVEKNIQVEDSKGRYDKQNLILSWSFHMTGIKLAIGLFPILMIS